MPVATPEIYAEMLDTAQGEAASPSRRSTCRRRRPSTPPSRASPRPESDGIIQVSHRRRGVLLRPDRQEHGDRLARVRGVRRRGGQELPDHRRPAHRPLPQGQARRLRPAADRGSAERVKAGGKRRSSSRTCGTAPPCRWTRTSRSPRSCSPCAAGGQRRSSRSRSASSAARRTASSGEIDEKLYTTPEDAIATVEALGLGEQGPLHGGADLRQRARRLQAGQRQAAPRDPQGDPGRHRSAPSRLRHRRASRSTWSSTAARARRTQEIAEAVDYGVVKMNIDTDTQYAFTRPVADHMFTQLRRRAEGRRRGRQQEGLRPARLGQGRRGRHGRPRRRGLQQPQRDRPHPRLTPQRHTRRAIDGSVRMTSRGDGHADPELEHQEAAQRLGRRCRLAGSARCAASRDATIPGQCAIRSSSRVRSARRCTEAAGRVAGGQAGGEAVLARDIEGGAGEAGGRPARRAGRGRMTGRAPR